MKLLTLAIASYNMEEFLDKCLESVSEPDIPDSLEVIVINDGSKDRTSSIAHIYEKLRPDIIRIVEKENGHYGSCINKALELATGKYFRPLDADDWVNIDSLIRLLDKLSTCNADLVITEFSIYKESKKDKNKIPKNVKIGQEYNLKEFDVEKNKCTSLFSMHGMTYKTEKLRESNLQLHTGIHYTDTEYILLPLDHVDTLIFYNLDLYQYNMMREGQSIQKSIQHQANDSFYILSIYLIEYYLKSSITNNDIIRSNQRCILRRVLFFFFVSTLVFGDLNNQKLRKQLDDIEKLVNKNKELRRDAISFGYKGIPFVRIWFYFHVRIFKYIPKSIL